MENRARRPISNSGSEAETRMKCDIQRDNDLEISRINGLQ